MKLPIGSLVAVCIGFRHMNDHIGEPDWLAGKVITEPTQEELDEGLRVEGEVQVEVPIDEVLHGRVVDLDGNFLVSQAEKKAGKLLRWVSPADPAFSEPGTWRPDPKAAAEARKAAQAERDAKVKERDERLAEAKQKAAKATANVKANQAALSAEQKAAQAELDAAARTTAKKA